MKDEPNPEEEGDTRDVVDNAVSEATASFDSVSLSGSLTVYVPSEIEGLDEQTLEDSDKSEEEVKEKIAKRKAGRLMSKEYGVYGVGLPSETLVDRVGDRTLEIPEMDVPVEEWRVSFIIHQFAR